MQRTRQVAEVQECTFHPRVNKTSAQMMAERTEALRVLQVSPYEQLFQDALRRQAKQKELQSWLPEEATFKPNVNKSNMAQAYLNRSFETMGQSVGNASKADANDTSSEAPSMRASVVDRLYLNMEKVG